MSDEGFGTGPFGEGPFGRSDYASEALWQRSVPDGTKNDDEEAGGDLEAFLRGPAAEMVERQRHLALELPDQVDPLEVRSGQEAAEHVTVDSVERIQNNQVRVTLEDTDDNLDVLERMFPRSEDADGRPRGDGWVAAINRVPHHISSVDAWNEEIEFKTELKVPSTLEVRPPDLLKPLASNYGVVVDRRDPPDYSRRALYRHTLVRDLKVCDRMFSLLGDIYGFDVNVENLWQITKPIYDRLLKTDPLKVYTVEYPPGSGQTQYLTEIPYLAHQYDEIAADRIPADSRDTVSLDVTITSVTEVSNHRWRVTFDASDDDDVDSINTTGHWKVEDGDGDVHWIESSDANNPSVEVIAGDAPTTGGGRLLHEATAATKPEWRPAPAYAVDIRTDEVTQEPEASTAELERRISERIESYVPLHIRALKKTFVSRSTWTLPFVGSVRSALIRTFSSTVNIFEQTYYDETKADVQSADEDVFQVKTSDLKTF